MLLTQLEPMIKDIATTQAATTTTPAVILPYAYYAFPKPGQAPPYIVYLSPGRSDLFADDINYQQILDLNIELYTKTKRYDLETVIEANMKAAGLAYSKTESVIESDGVFMITYATEVLING